MKDFLLSCFLGGLLAGGGAVGWHILESTVLAPPIEISVESWVITNQIRVYNKSNKTLACCALREGFPPSHFTIKPYDSTSVWCSGEEVEIEVSGYWSSLFYTNNGNGTYSTHFD